MFAKSKQIGLVSLFLVLGAMVGGCAESVGNEPASFASNQRPVAFLSRPTPFPMVRVDEVRAVKVDAIAQQRSETKHATRTAGGR
jgi:hypothetical protein